MSEIHLSADGGHHAAAQLTNEALQALLRAALLELAVRTDRDTYEEVLMGAVSERADADQLVCEIRRQRDLMWFAAEVERDIDSLPTIADRDRNVGMYP